LIPTAVFKPCPKIIKKKKDDKNEKEKEKNKGICRVKVISCVMDSVEK